MDYICEFEDRPAQPVLSVRLRAAVQDLPRVFGQTFGEIMAYLAELGEQPAGMPFAAYHGLPEMNMQDIDLEIGFPVARPLAGRDHIQPSEQPAGRWALTTNIGPYDSVGPAYEALYKAIGEAGREPTDVAYEVYQSEPETPPEQIKTVIMIPLK